MIDLTKILVTGGNGLLAREIKKNIPVAQFADKNALDVTDMNMVEQYFNSHTIDLVIHTAALMPPMKSKEDPVAAINVNIIGVGNITKACIKRDIKLIYISTDYVFKGDRGNYKEDDELLPVNEYAWGKLGGECCVKLYPKSLIVRMSFGPPEFPYPKAFEDQWTSKETVGAVAKKICFLIGKDISGVIHIGGVRRTVLEYARSLANGDKVLSQKRADLRTGYILPKDTSLNSDKFIKLNN